MLLDELQSLTERVLVELDLYSEDAFWQVLRTGAVESRYEYLQQVHGPARGFFQMEPLTAKDIADNYLAFRFDLNSKLNALIGVPQWDQNPGWHLETKLDLQIALCRVHYLRDSDPIPDHRNLHGQAEYWKRVYNTTEGAGTIDHFLTTCADFGVN